MKKTGGEMQYRTPRFVWCDEAAQAIRWSKGRVQNSTKGHFKEARADHFVRVVAGVDKDTAPVAVDGSAWLLASTAVNVDDVSESKNTGTAAAAADAGEAAAATAKRHHVKARRTSVFAGLHDAMSERCDRITADACFSLVHATDEKKDLDLHLDRAASHSRVVGAVRHRRNQWAEAFSCFLQRHAPAAAAAAVASAAASAVAASGGGT